MLSSIGSPDTQPPPREYLLHQAKLWGDRGDAFQALGLPNDLSFELQLSIALGASIWEHRREVGGKILQAQAYSRLIAMLDSRSMQAHVRSDADWSDLKALSISSVALHRAFIPKELIVIPMWDLVWQYGFYHPMAWRQLPIDFAYLPLNLRRLPLTSNGMMPDCSIQVIQQLVNASSSYSQLVATMKLDPELIFKSIVALYHSRAIQISGVSASNAVKY